MKGRGKTKAELLEELGQARTRIAQLEAADAEQPRVEETLREGEPRLRRLLDQAGDALFLVRPDGRFVDVNERACEVMGYTRDELLALSVQDIDPVFPREKFAEFSQTMKPGSPVTFEAVHQRKDGTTFPVEIRTGLINVQGENYFLSLVRDITDRKRAAAALSWESAVNAAVAALGSALISPAPIEEISAMVLEHAKRLTGSVIGYVGYIDPDTGHLVAPTLSRDVWEECRVSDKDFRFEEFHGLWGWVLNEGKPLLANAPPDDARSGGTPSGHLPIRRFLSAPALIADTVVGQVAVANADRDYTDQDVAAVERLAALYAVSIHRRRVEAALRLRTHDLGERVKELSCLYGLSNLVETPGISLEEIMQGTVDLIPPSWQYPAMTCARLVLEGREFRTRKFEETPWRQAGEIRVHGDVAGMLEVFYLEERPESDEGPFLKEERSLIDAVTERLGAVIEHRHASGEIARLARFPSENPNPVLRTSRDGRITYANGSSRGLLEDWGCDVGQDLPDRFREAARQAFASGVKQEMEVAFADRILSLTLAPVAEADCVNLYGFDVTERKRAEEALQASQRFLRIANRHLDMASMLDEFAAELQRFTGCAAVGIRILDPKGNIPYQSHRGFPQEFYESENYLSIESDHCLCINVVKGETDPNLPYYTEGGSFHMNETTRFLAGLAEEDRGRTRNVCSRFGYESVALIPIRRADEIIGLIHLADPRDGRVPSDMVEGLEREGLQLGTAIQRVLAEEALRRAHDELEQRVTERTAELGRANELLRQEIAERKRLEREILQISAGEQRRIGQDLHDVLGQTLTGMAFLSKALQGTLSAKSLEESSDAAKIVELANQATVQTRHLARGLCPVELEADGLMTALGELAGEVENVFGVQCSFLCDGPGLVHDDSTASQLYLIAQEAVHNALRHGEARNVMIMLTASDGRVRAGCSPAESVRGFTSRSRRLAPIRLC